MRDVLNAYLHGLPRSKRRDALTEISGILQANIQSLSVDELEERSGLETTMRAVTAILEGDGNAEYIAEKLSNGFGELVRTLGKSRKDFARLLNSGRLIEAVAKAKSKSA